MKYSPAILSTVLHGQNTNRNMRLLFRFILILIVMVTAFSVAFHFLMAFEERDFSWITGFYWTLTVRTTLGFGDITFQSDLGRAFSILVLLSGVVFFLTLLPFTFIKFFYGPWVEAEARKRAPRELSRETKHHVIITAFNPVTLALIEKLKVHQEPYVLIEENFQQALEPNDAGIRVAVGSIDDLETYRKMRVEQAALVVAAGTDEINTNIAFTVRELSEKVRIITTADSPYSEHILGMAGSNKVLQVYPRSADPHSGAGRTHSDRHLRRGKKIYSGDYLNEDRGMNYDAPYGVAYKITVSVKKPEGTLLPLSEQFEIKLDGIDHANGSHYKTLIVTDY